MENNRKCSIYLGCKFKKDRLTTPFIRLTIEAIHPDISQNAVTELCCALANVITIPECFDLNNKPFEIIPTVRSVRKKKNGSKKR